MENEARGSGLSRDGTRQVVSPSMRNNSRPVASSRTRGHSLRKTGARLDQVLAVVKHEQQFARNKISDPCVEQHFAATLAAPERGRQGIWHQAGGLYRSQIDQPHAIGERIEQARRDLERRAMSPGERQSAVASWRTVSR